MNRREFIEGAATGLGTAAVTVNFAPKVLASISAAAQSRNPTSALNAARDEDFWREVKGAFSTSRTLINLDNGNICPSPRAVTESMVRYKWMEEEAPAYTIFDVLVPWATNIFKGLAAQFGCSPEEIALARNATEALQTILLGIELKPGDEVLTTTHDYFSMQQALDQRAMREGIVVKRVPVPAPVTSMDQLVEIFERGITPKTRLILVCHAVNLTGQFLPIKRICEMAHKKGIEVCVDAAQSFAQTVFQQDDLDCDYLGTSLHKWLLAPIGTGMLYVKRDKIGKVWPLMPADSKLKENVWKFMDVGTVSLAPFLAINDALTFHNTVGPERKEERLRYLTHYWVNRLKTLPKIEFLTNFDSPEMSCGLATFRLQGVDSNAFEDYLKRKHAILVQSMSKRSWAPEIHGIRITPNLYTTLQELDTFCAVVEEVAKKGLPATN